MLSMAPLGLIPMPLGAWLGLPLGLALSFLLALWARRRGLLDASTGTLGARKLQNSPVPPVGGLGIFLSLLILHYALDWDGLWYLPFGSAAMYFSTPMVLGMGLLPVLVVGLWDDLLPAGLGAGAKLAAQALALAPLALGLVGVLALSEADLAAGWNPGLGGLALLLVGLLALNVLNTFDNADGAAAGVSCVGFLVASVGASSLAASAGGLGLGAVCLGFLFLNTNARPLAGSRPGSGAPSAYLGDSGAFALALLLLLQPGAWPALWIPALDLARLSVVRWRAGSRPWIGDRRHLAHRLQRLGLGPRAVTLALMLLSLPGCLGLQNWAQGPNMALLGLGLGAVGFGLALWLTRAVAHPLDS